MRVLLLSRYDRLGPSSRMRHYQFLPLLAEHGITVDVQFLLPDTYLSSLYTGGRRPLPTILPAYLSRLAKLLSLPLSSTRYDLLWIEKEVLPWLPYAVERLLLAMAPAYIVDFDDAWFHHYDRHRFPAVRTVLGEKLDRLMQNAALVTVGNTYLRERAEAAGARRILTLPTTVDPSRYPITKPPVGKPMPTIGWIGSPATAAYLELVRAPLEAMVAAGSADVTLIGAGEKAVVGLPARRLIWTEDSEAAGILSFDIGIMPLADTVWERGKCGYKLIQYMACGRPVVASPVGANREIVEHGVNGFLADSPEDWRRALDRLCADPDLRRTMGTAGRAKVERLYARDKVGAQLARAMLNLSGSQPGVPIPPPSFPDGSR
ncbi:MAG TPA: glycosyltransferase family 4 protein [Azospirillum sp.]|nr:glycosyltransferase family 4 protein [Azospirillum sp.]